MTHPDAEHWDNHYAKEGVAWLKNAPCPLLLDFAHLLPTQGLALDAAAGVGVNGLFLAARGLHVVALDISEVGLRLAMQQAKERGVWVETAVFDLTHLWLPPRTFDVILNFRFLERATFPAYRRALKPGGLLFFETFLATNANVPHPHYYLKPGELKHAFPEFSILHSTQITIERAAAHPPKIAEQLIARKPPSNFMP